MTNPLQIHDPAQPDVEDSPFDPPGSSAQAPRESPQQLAEITYGPESPLKDPRRLFGEMWRDLLASRELAWRLAIRDIKALYRQSMLGYLWAIVPPLVSTLTFVMLRRGGVFQIADVGMPYPIYVLTGMVIWQVFAEAVLSPLKNFNSNLALLTKIKFPREALIIAGLLVAMFNLVFRLAVLGVALVLLQIDVGPTVAMFPLGVAAVILLGTFVGLVLTPIGILYQDVQRGLTFVLGFWVFATPVLLPMANSGVARTVMELNPVTPLVIVSRQWLVGEPATDLAAFVAISMVSIVGIVLGWILLRVSLPHVIVRLGM